jgi:hypothetical protein
MRGEMDVCVSIVYVGKEKIEERDGLARGGEGNMGCGSDERVEGQKGACGR